MNKFYITTSIPYVNAAPHIGHALEFVQADVIARYQRSQGKEVYFLSGSDENAIKNVQAAQKAGIPVRQLVDQNSKTFGDLLSKLNISTDQFIRTTEERHKKGAQALWKATDPQYLYKKTYQGLYCVGCEAFYKKEELNESGECVEHPGRKPEIIEEENYFFKLSAFAPWLKDLISRDKIKIVPESRKNEVLGFIEKGLEDFSVSRPVERSKNWGVLVPGDESQTIYVWYDALANYITALGYPDEQAPLYKNFWKEGDVRLHAIGKGIIRFHAVYWPAMLKAAGVELPTSEFVHGYITVDGQKMSKTLGNVVDPLFLIQEYGADAVRYFFLREIPATEDGDFSVQKLEARYNSDLAGGLGNLVARVLAMAEKAVPGFEIPQRSTDKRIQKESEEATKNTRKALEEFRFGDALSEIWKFLSVCDQYIDKEKPWEKTPKQKEVLLNLLFALSSISALIEPFLPETTKAIQLQLQGKERKALFPRVV